MAEFLYQALNNQGQEIESSLEAENLAQAQRSLEEQNLHVFELKAKEEAEQEQAAAGGLNFLQGQDELLDFTKQLANLLESGIQLGEALEIISQLTAGSDFNGVVRDIYASLKAGQNFAEALEEHPKYFSDGYIGMIKAGEEGGFLALSCQRLKQDLETSKELKSFMITSLIYPAVLVVVTILAVLVMITYVLPKFAAIYENYDDSLPYLTELLLNISGFISQYGLWIVLFATVAIIAAALYYQRDAAKKKVDRWLLMVPGLGNLLAMINGAKIARNLGTMLDSGVPLLKALQFSRRVTNNRALKEALSNSAQQVKKGSNLSDALEESNLFAPLLIYMTGIGERTGNLSSMLLQLAANLEEEYRGSLEKLMKIFEPLIILVMGIIIGLIVVAMLLPILNINTISI